MQLRLDYIKSGTVGLAVTAPPTGGGKGGSGSKGSKKGGRRGKNGRSAVVPAARGVNSRNARAAARKKAEAEGTEAGNDDDDSDDDDGGDDDDEEEEEEGDDDEEAPARLKARPGEEVLRSPSRKCSIFAASSPRNATELADHRSRYAFARAASTRTAFASGVSPSSSSASAAAPPPPAADSDGCLGPVRVPSRPPFFAQPCR